MVPEPALLCLLLSRSDSANSLPQLLAPRLHPKRAVFFGIGFGVTKETWFPDVNQTGADYELSEGLSPLARHQSDLTVVQGCSNQYSNEAHWGSTFWLTGANRYSVPGQNMANSISADQVVAQHLGQDTRFSSLPLNGSDEQGHGPRTFPGLGSTR